MVELRLEPMSSGTKVCGPTLLSLCYAPRTPTPRANVFGLEEPLGILALVFSLLQIIITS